MDATPTPPPPKRLRRPRWLEHLLVAAVAVVFTLVRLLPLGVARWAARTIGRLIYFVGGPGFMGVQRNLRIAFGPELDGRRARELARAFWVHIAQSTVEALQLSAWTRENCAWHLELAEPEQLAAFRSRGCGVIIISGHIGSWEVGQYGLALLGYPIRPLYNPGTSAPLSEYLKGERERSGMQVLSRLEHPWALKKALDRGAWLCIAGDLNAGRRAEFVPFFGVQASTYLTPAALQQATGCPILVVTTARQTDGRHRLKIWRVLEAQGTADRHADLLKTMGDVHEGLEEAIRAFPEQWLWTYRRWRSRPPGETAGLDGLPPRLENTGRP